MLSSGLLRASFVENKFDQDYIQISVYLDFSSTLSGLPDVYLGPQKIP